MAERQSFELNSKISRSNRKTHNNPRFLEFFHSQKSTCSSISETRRSRSSFLKKELKLRRKASTAIFEMLERNNQEDFKDLMEKTRIFSSLKNFRANNLDCRFGKAYVLDQNEVSLILPGKLNIIKKTDPNQQREGHIILEEQVAKDMMKESFGSSLGSSSSHSFGMLHEEKLDLSPELKQSFGASSNSESSYESGLQAK
jgi:hypothetical protein